MIKLIVAFDKNYLIGKNNHLPWKIPEDLKHFFDTVKNKTILVGEITFASLNLELFKDVNIIVLTQDKDFYSPYVIKNYYDIKEVIKDYENKELFISGGAKIFASFIPYVDEFIFTKINREYEGDSYFPFELINFNDYKLIKTKSLNSFTEVFYYRK